MECTTSAARRRGAVGAAVDGDTAVSHAPSRVRRRECLPQAAIEIVDIVPTLDLPVDTNVIIPTEDQETPTKTTKTIKITTMTTMI
jgi:hypothetical protein